MNANTLALFFDNVDIIKGCAFAPNVEYIKLINCSLKTLLTYKPRLILYPIDNLLISFFVSFSQINILSYKIKIDNDLPLTMITLAYDYNNSICVRFNCFVLVTNCYHVLFVGVNGDNECLD